MYIYIFIEIFERLLYLVMSTIKMDAIQTKLRLAYKRPTARRTTVNIVIIIITCRENNLQ